MKTREVSFKYFVVEMKIEGGTAGVKFSGASNVSTPGAEALRARAGGCPSGLFRRTPLWDRGRGQSVRFPRRSAGITALLRNNLRTKGVSVAPGRKMSKASLPLPYPSPSPSFILAHKEHNALLAQFINGHIHRP